ncbi:hypothetical protein V5799_020996 [Amblyomma americanum]|uniref:Uncharacterized protein n=1 Tax=Amblyomma americanum TaxID=6943 RepID=A0AAQ4FS94_AMBAM
MMERSKCILKYFVMLCKDCILRNLHIVYLVCVPKIIAVRCTFAFCYKISVVELCLDLFCNPANNKKKGFNTRMTCWQHIYW